MSKRIRAAPQLLDVDTGGTGDTNKKKHKIATDKTSDVSAPLLQSELHDGTLSSVNQRECRTSSPFIADNTSKIYTNTYGGYSCDRFNDRSDAFQSIYSMVLNLTDYDFETALNVAEFVESRGYLTLSSLYDISEEEWSEIDIPNHLSSEILELLECDSDISADISGFSVVLEDTDHRHHQLDAFEDQALSGLELYPFESTDSGMARFEEVDLSDSPDSPDSDIDIDGIDTSTIPIPIPTPMPIHTNPIPRTKQMNLNEKDLTSVIKYLNQCLPTRTALAVTSSAASPKSLNIPLAVESPRKPLPLVRLGTSTERRAIRKARSVLMFLNECEHRAWSDIEFEAHAIAKHTLYELVMRKESIKRFT